MRIQIYFSIFFILFPLAVVAQIQSPGYRAEFGSILQAGNMKPFWMISNQGGKFHPENSSLFGNYGLRITRISLIIKISRINP